MSLPDAVVPADGEGLEWEDVEEWDCVMVDDDSNAQGVNVTINLTETGTLEGASAAYYIMCPLT
jgi:hypothetical protein